MDTYTIRLATPDDSRTISLHRRRMFYEMGHTDAAALDSATAAFETWVRDKLAVGEYVGWLAEDERGQVVAGAGIYLIPWPPGVIVSSPRLVYVMNVYTEADHRGRGLARRLMEAVMAWCRERGYVNLSLHASNIGRSIYEKLGFEPTNEMRIQL